MNKHNKVGAVVYFIIKYLIIGFIISGSILTICYLIGRRSPGIMSDILTYVGVSSIFGTQSSIKDLNGYQYARSTGNKNEGCYIIEFTYLTS